MTLSFEERALIDAAVAAGRVQKVPRGKSGQPAMRWCAKAKTLISVNEDGARVKGGWSGANAKGKRISPEVAKRRMKVLELAQAGNPPKAIAAMLGVETRLVSGDVTHLRENGHVVPDFRATRTNEQNPTTDLQDEILSLCDGSLTAREIAEKVGSKDSYVRATARQFSKPLKAFQRAGAKYKTPNKRRSEVERLAGQGHSNRQIAKRLGVSESTIAVDMKALGLSSGYVGDVNQRRREIGHLREQGKTVREIAAELNCSRSTVQNGLKELAQQSEAA